MAIVVIGGHSRNIGKTGVICSLIAALPERHWTAIKITQCKHGDGTGELCDCEFGDQAVAVSEEHDVLSRTDSSRYLAAGADRSIWVRTRRGQLQAVMPRIFAEISMAENVIFESNSLLGFLKPDVYACVLDAEVADFKESARGYLERADAILLRGALIEGQAWRGVALDLIERVPRFQMDGLGYCPDEFVAFVTRQLDDASSRCCLKEVTSAGST